MTEEQIDGAADAGVRAERKAAEYRQYGAPPGPSDKKPDEVAQKAGCKRNPEQGKEPQHPFARHGPRRKEQRGRRNREADLLPEHPGE